MAQQTTPAPVATLPPPPPIPESRVLSTDQIQKYLDENKQLILAILDNQNLGKVSESAQYQAQLQRNLLFLAALADEQPQTKAIRAQMMPQGVIPQAQGVTTVVQVQPITQQVHLEPQSQSPQNPATTDQSAATTTADTPKLASSAEADAGPSPMMPQGVIPQAQGVSTVVQVQPIPQQVHQEPQSQPSQNPATTDQSAATTTANTPELASSAEADAGPSPVPESQTNEQIASGGET